MKYHRVASHDSILFCIDATAPLRRQPVISLLSEPLSNVCRGTPPLPEPIPPLSFLLSDTLKAPKWASGVRFILVDVEPSQRDAELAAVTLVGDAAMAVGALRRELMEGAWIQPER